ncbi:MAG: indolepyruvate ferredoxin oxidoreductase subunit alpha [Clostridia bacterium]|nr:indolepyruvate ferredoxin oxidoreductase subunit alpha [Clostridia bacterium]
MIKNISGNEAVAIAAVNAGAAVITGYPGTPSSETVGSLWGKNIEGVHVEWSTNEKVALEIAAAASWANKRALCTMKMSGLNVAYDSLVSIAYSGCTGALVVYVCDDPGVSAGMPEQDIRGFAKMTDMPVIDVASVDESYWLTKYAFELSERIQSPVILRSVTSVALSHSTVDIPDMMPPAQAEPHVYKDIEKFTKAGAKICMDQHKRLIESLEIARQYMREDVINQLCIAKDTSLGIIVSGVCASYLDEGMELARKHADFHAVSSLVVRSTVPLPTDEIREMIENCDTIVVVEENEPYVEHGVMLEAFKLGKKIRVIGKEDGTLSRIGNFDAMSIAVAVLTALDCEIPSEFTERLGAESLCTKRPIGVCAGCPHRGVFMSINEALRRMGIKKDEAIVTGDIGCTILGMSPPFNTLWTEVSMGASSPMAQGFIHAGIKTPVISTIGDSTFLHGGIPGVINAVQNNVDMLTIIMDNGWTCMTGMQVNAGTSKEYQAKEFHNRVDIAKIVPALGVEHFAVHDPYDLEGMTALIGDMLKLSGVKVILARRECAIQAARRKVKYGIMSVDQDKCTKCKLCIMKTGCPGLVYDGSNVHIDKKLCNGCGICKSLCKFNALVKEEI